MKAKETKRNRSTLAVTCVAALFAGVVFSSASVASAKPDLKATAEKIISQVANVKEGDRVVLRGDVRDIELIEELALAAWKRGAEVIQLVNREETARRYFEDVPAKYDGMPLKLALKLAEAETVEITVSGQAYPGLFDKVSSERVVAIGQREQAVFQALMKRGVRLVAVGNGLYPTEATAKGYGLKLDQLSGLYWDGINVDYAKMQATGTALAAVLNAGKEVHITHPNGTDLTCRIEKRPVFVSDGVISKEDTDKGGAALQVWLPAGEVYVTPVAGSAEGKIVFDSLPYGAGAISGATFTFKAGKLVSHDAKAGSEYDLWKDRYAAAPKGKDAFAVVDLGINPNVKIPAGSKLTSWVPAGAVSLGFGGDLWAGGSNECPWATSGSLNGCTVTVDGKIVVENGVLKVM